jgi:uncharacterized DUF497 family protein
MVFDWDGANRSHIARHGVTPEDCEAACQDLEAETIDWPSDVEPRWRTIGKIGDRRLMVFWTLRNSAIRIVTAWWIGKRTRI